MKIFLGGSKSYTDLSDVPERLIKRLDWYCSVGHEFLIGDCRGADALIQGYLAEREYPRVIVYSSGDTVRNNIGGWKTVNVKCDPACIGFEFYRQKDVQMGLDCDIGIMWWDKNSKGTKQNIIDLAALGKRVDVISSKSGYFWTIYQYNINMIDRI